MAEDTPRDTNETPNRASATEKAEGSRENVEDGTNAQQQAAGITNRPLEREQEEQEQLPPRGQSKDGTHA